MSTHTYRPVTSNAARIGLLAPIGLAGAAIAGVLTEIPPASIAILAFSAGALMVVMTNTLRRAKAHENA